MTHPRFVLLALAAALAATNAPAAGAAEAYDNCTGTIAVLPAVIGTQGTWCMKSDLSTAVASGIAIDVQANNVTIECNGFKLGGLQAGLGTATTGIRADVRSNTTIRGCNIRGFRTGVELASPNGGYVVEDNRFDANTGTALKVFGEGSRIQRNQVLRTGGASGTGIAYAYGIWTEGTMDVLDNQIHDIAYAETASVDTAVGIYVGNAEGGLVAGNVISGLFSGPADLAMGIYVFEGIGTVVRDNDITGMDQPNSWGTYCSSAATILRGNVISHHDTGNLACLDDGDNHIESVDPT